MKHWLTRWTLGAVALGLVMSLLAGCGAGLASGSASSDTVVVGSKNFTENIILGEIMAQLLEAKTKLKVERKLNLGGTFVNFNALKKGQIDLYPDYTGTGLTAILKEPVISDPDKAYARVKAAYHDKFQLAWLQPFGFNDTYVLAMRKADAEKYNVKTVSDLKAVAPKLVFGGEQEFFNRKDGYPGLTQAYGLDFKAKKAMDTGLKYKAVANKDIDVTDAFSTDGDLLRYHLTTLNDDKNFFPPYYAAPVVREATLTAHPEIKDVLNLLAGTIDEATMQQLNYQVDVEGKKVFDVAHAFLVKQGLLTK